MQRLKREVSVPTGHEIAQGVEERPVRTGVIAALALLLLLGSTTSARGGEGDGRPSNGSQAGPRAGSAPPKLANGKGGAGRRGPAGGAGAGRTNRPDDDAARRERHPSGLGDYPIQIPELVVTGSRVEEDPFQSPRGISVVDWGKVVRRRGSASTPAELLRGEPGVFLQQTGRRGGAPIIRGLIGKFVLPLYDGVRLTDGTIFGGPNGFFNNIDRLSIDHIEVVRGPSSVLYGSDAIGGTLNIIPRRFDGFPDEFTFDVDLYGNWQSASRQFTERIEVSGGKRPFNLLVGGTFVNAGDTRGGGGLGRLSNTSWKERNIDARFGFQLARGHVLEVAYLRAQRQDVFRFDQPWETPRMNDWWRAHTSLFLTGSGLRKRMTKTPVSTTQLATISYTGEHPTRFWEEAKARAYWRGEYDETVRGSEQSTTTREDTTTRKRDVFGLSAQFTSPAGRANRVIYGIDARLDDVDSGSAFRETFDKVSGARLTMTPRTPRNPDARYYDVGTFLYDEFRGVRRTTLSAGLRFNYTRITSDPTAATTPSPLTPAELELDTSFTSLTWGLGAVYELTRHVNVVANVGSGFRSPSISDTLRTGAFTFGVGVPSPDVRPETAITYELGFKVRADRFRGGVTGFYTNLRNLIESSPGTIGGADFIDLNGDGIKQDDEQVFVKENVGRAYVWGIEAEAQWEFLRTRRVGSVLVFGNATFTRGRNRTAHEPLRFVPPINGIVGLRWEKEGGALRARRFWAEIVAPWSTRKPKRDFSPTDLRDTAQFPREPGRLPGWLRLDFRAGVDLGASLTLSLAVTNILNKEYQSFGSRLPGDGRSLSLSLNLEL